MVQVSPTDFGTPGPTEKKSITQVERVIDSSSTLAQKKTDGNDMDVSVNGGFSPQIIH